MSKENRRKYDLTVSRMAGNIASGLVARYSTGDLMKDKDRQQRIAEVSVGVARRIAKELSK